MGLDPDALENEKYIELFQNYANGMASALDRRVVLATLKIAMNRDQIRVTNASKDAKGVPSFPYLIAGKPAAKK